MAIIAGAIALLGAAVSAYGAIRQGQQAEAVGRYNATVAQQQAESARQAAAADAETKRRQYERILGTQRARYGASGVIGSEGSPLLVMMQSEEEAALDVARVRYGGTAQAYGLESESRLSRFQGAFARRQSYLTATGTLLSGVGSAAGSYAKYKTPSTTTVPAYRGGYD